MGTTRVAMCEDGSILRLDLVPYGVSKPGGHRIAFQFQFVAFGNFRHPSKLSLPDQPVGADAECGERAGVHESLIGTHALAGEAARHHADDGGEGDHG